MAKKSDLVVEDGAIDRLNNVYLHTKRSNIYVALENVDFIWNERDVLSVDKLWKKGYSIHFISAEFGRSVNDVFALLWDRLEQGFIQERPGGIYGRS